MLVEKLNYDGLYIYSSSSFERANTQLNVIPQTIFSSGKVWGNNGFVTGTLSRTYNLLKEEYLQRINLINDLSSNILELDPSITNLSELYTGMYVPSDLPVINMSNITDMADMFPEEFYGFSYNSAYSNFANSIPYANQLSSPLFSSCGISLSYFSTNDINVIAAKGYKDAIVPDTTNWGTNYRITLNNGTPFNYLKSSTEYGEFDRYGKKLGNYFTNSKFRNSTVKIEDLGTEGSLISLERFINPYSTITIKNMDLSLAKTYNVLSTKRMFDGDEYIMNISNFDTSNVLDMSYMFCGCNNLTKCPEFNTINVTNMTHMFCNCNKLTSVANFNTANVTNMAYMFEECNVISSVTNINTINATNMANMFAYCKNISTIPDLDTSNATNLSGLFYYCGKITVAPNLNTSKVIDMSGMFWWSKITELPDYDTSNVTNMHYIALGCNLTKFPNFNFTKVTDFSSPFRYDLIPSIPNNMDFSNLINGSSAFENMKLITDFPDLNTPNLRNANHMFANSVLLTNMPNIVYTNCEQFYGLFFGCKNMENFPESIECPNLLNTGYMFGSCEKMVSAPDLPSSNNITNMSGMFSYCTNLVNLPQYNTSQVSYFGDFLLNCKNLSDASIQNAINMFLNSAVTNTSCMNLSSSNNRGPLYNTGISSSRYSNRLSEITAAGWKY